MTLHETVKQLQVKVSNLKERLKTFKLVPPTSRIDFALFNNLNFKRLEKNLILLELEDSIRDVKKKTIENLGKSKQ